MAADPQNAHLMKCMEVWGGNQAVDSGVVMAGLDAWLYSRPYQDAIGGGDVHYVSSCATGRVTRLLLADVSGHGATVADTAANLRLLMRRYVNHIDQSKFVQLMNRQFAALADSGKFATAVVATFFAPTNQMTVCVAGHPPPLLYRAKTGRWSIMQQDRKPTGGGSNVPLGIIDSGRYDVHQLRLRVGDLVLLYTDSLIESRAADGRLVGTQGLCEIVDSLDATLPDAFIAALTDKLAQIADGNLTQDDVTLLLFRPNGLAPRVPLADRVLAPVRVAGGVIRSLFAGGRAVPWPQCSVTNIGGAIFDRLNRRRDTDMQDLHNSDS